MSDYTEAAPSVSRLVDAEQFAIDFPADAPPAPPLPNPTGAAKVALYAAYKAEYNSNGGAVDLRALAIAQGVPLHWCRILALEVAAARAVVHAEPV